MLENENPESSLIDENIPDNVDEFFRDDDGENLTPEEMASSSSVDLTSDEVDSAAEAAYAKTLSDSAEKKIDPTRLSKIKTLNLFEINAKAFFNSLVDKSNPVVNGEAMADGSISFVPSSVRSFKTGRMYTGINQFIALKYCNDLGFKKDKDGNYYVLTYNQGNGSGQKVTIDGKEYSGRFPDGSWCFKQGSNKFPMATYHKASVDKNGKSYPERYNTYYLYSAMDLNDPNRTRGVPAEVVQPKRLPDGVIDARDPNITPETYFAKYHAACTHGFTFKTTQEVQEKVRQETIQLLRPALEQGKFFSVNQFCNNAAKNAKQYSTEAFTRLNERVKAARGEQKASPSLAKKENENGIMF